MKFRPDYWQHKLSVYLHDPPHKCVSIQKHEQWAQEVAEILGCSIASKEQYQNADMIASGLTRAAMPGYSTDSKQNGSIDFLESPVITHPVVDCNTLKLDLPADISPNLVHKSVLEVLSIDTKKLPATSNDEDRAKQLFYYLHFALKKRLRNENAGGLGAAWDLLPADTRMPDHSIWQHTALSSAIASSMREDTSENVSLAVFSITPVQQFIVRARKLRDHWFGSVILSYLSFVGIRHVSKTVGPDHIVYPSLHDQSLVERWIGKEYGLKTMLEEQDALLRGFTEVGKTIASFPNKFVFIAPSGTVEEICCGIQEAVNAEWIRISEIVRDFIGTNAKIAQLFEHQVSDYWHYSHAAARLPMIDEMDGLGALLHRDRWKNEAETIKEFAKGYSDAGPRTARVYAATHSLIQGVLASTKLQPNRIRKPQSGEKCPLCGEHEVLHDLDHPEGGAAKKYSDGVRKFWDSMRSRFNTEGSTTEVGKGERLCAVCSVKRFLPRALKQQGLRDELLYEVVADMESFPATTAIAAHNYLAGLDKTVGIPKAKRNALIDALHDSKKDNGLDDDISVEIRNIIESGKARGVTFTDRDKYYAVLLMDGDKMGDLINGATVTATWGSVIHPELRTRYADPLFQPSKDVLKGYLDKKRTLNPALHAAISESLNSFARFAVAPLVAAEGRLIYAGGDDVCAILPLDTALETADALRKAYTGSFVHYTSNGTESCSDKCAITGKMGIHFGKAPGISISAAIVIAHHKEPLREVLKDAHKLLDGVAKGKAGRNALAIRLKKRSGGDRDFYCKWDEKNPFMENETILDSFREVANGVGNSLSTSLIYRLSTLKDGIAPMKNNLSAHKLRIEKLFAYEVQHSEVAAPIRPEDAGRLAGICLRLGDEEVGTEWFNPEAAVIAGFFGRKEKR